jgi:polysaccharide deacetylase family protein (PEP-CTERM system associated)
VNVAQSEQSRKYVLLTVDVEDWFQVENFKGSIPFSSWGSLERRVERNTHRLLDFFSSVDLIRSQRESEFTGYRNPAHSREPDTVATSPNSLKATFFILGWVAERMPNLVREIFLRGHEVASHGYYHRLNSQCSSEDLKKDIEDSKKLLDDILGVPAKGYRAPSFSVNEQTLRIIEDCGYLYDSSFNSFAMNSRYGRIDLARCAKSGIACSVSKNLYEIPISNLQLGRHVLPFGGGGYFRLIPGPLFMQGVRSILKSQNAFVFYMHPWEIDPLQPRVKQAPWLSKFRHYANLNRTLPKLSMLCNDFKQCHFVSCHEYLAVMSTKSRP